MIKLGTLNYDDGGKYEGDWKEDKKDGNGIWERKY